jgi:hypothetical protein
MTGRGDDEVGEDGLRTPFGPHVVSSNWIGRFAGMAVLGR